MLDRQTLDATILEIQSAFEALRPEIVSRSTNESVFVFNHVMRADSESAMIPVEKLPIAYAMVQRIKNKYALKFAEAGGVDAILLQLEQQIDAAIQRDATDEDRKKQYQAALNLLRNDNSHFHCSKSNLYHGQNLRELLAYMWLAASDIDAVLRPELEHNLHKIADKAEQTQARNEIRDRAQKHFFLVLRDIQRAHNESNPSDTVDKQSCVPGAVGRLVFASDPTHAVTVLTLQQRTYQEIEALSLLVAKSNELPADFTSLTHEIELFIDAELKDSRYEIKLSLFKLICEYQLGAYAKEDLDISVTDEDKKNYLEFLKGLSEKFAAFYKCITKIMPSLVHADGAIWEMIKERVYQSILHQMTHAFQNDWREDTALDRAFIEMLRRRGAQAILNEAADDLINNEKSIVDLRIKIRQLYERLNYHYDMMKIIITKHALNMDADAITKINEHILPHITVATEQIAADFGSYYKTLTELLNAKLSTEALKVKAQTLTVLPPPEEQVRTALSTAHKIQIILTQIERLWLALQNVSHSTNLNSTSILGQIHRLWLAFQNLSQSTNLKSSTNILDIIPAVDRSDDEWSAAITRILFSRLSIADKRQELQIIRDSLLCKNVAVAAVCTNMGVCFTNACMTEGNEFLNWQNRRELIGLLQSVFKGNDLGILKYHVLTSLSEIEDELKALIQDNELANEAFLTARKSLLFGVMQENEIVVCDQQAANRGAWVDVATRLFVRAQSQTTEVNGFKCIENFFMLTIGCNLELIDLRTIDISALRKLCAMYLIVAPASTQPIDSIFKLTETDTQHLRIQQLAYHLSLLLTALKPVNVLYGIGYIRIMEPTVAVTLFLSKELNEFEIVTRTSLGRPGLLSITSSTGESISHYRCNQMMIKTLRSFTVEVPAELFPIEQLKNRIIHFYTFESLKDFIFRASDKLTLTPPVTISNCERKMGVRYDEYVERRQDLIKTSVDSNNHSQRFFSSITQGATSSTASDSNTVITLPQPQVDAMGKTGGLFGSLDCNTLTTLRIGLQSACKSLSCKF